MNGRKRQIDRQIDRGASGFKPSHRHFNLSGAIDSSFVLGAGYLFSITWMGMSFEDDEEGVEVSEDAQDISLDWI